jgi:DNA-binding MarR family transcriptional regulator
MEVANESKSGSHARGKAEQDACCTQCREERGVGFPLYHSEVHLLDAIHLHEGENEQELAKRLGITKGAAAQVAKKLIGKALIESYQLSGNKKEVYSRLTELGERKEPWRGTGAIMSG